MSDLDAIRERPSEPLTKAGQSLLDEAQQEFGEEMPWFRAKIVAIEAEAIARVAELEAALADVLETIERLYHPEIGWYVHPAYLRAARLVDAALARPESKP
jgi:hypothetical protein